MNELMNTACETESPKSCGSDSTVRGSLLRTKENLEKRLAKVNAGLLVLDKNPEFSNNLETLLAGMKA